jgi:hypothetical protein
VTNRSERIENDHKVDLVTKAVAGDDIDAFEYIKFLAAASRIIDDVFDEFHNVSADQCCYAFELLFIKIPANKFYRKHQDLLFAHHISMWNAWQASNFLDKGDEVDKIYAHVLRDQVNEILPLVALLTQGHKKMKEINSLIRVLFKKQLGE